MSNSKFSPSILERVFGSSLQSELTLIYGEPGSGKTALVLQTAICSARDGYGALLVDVDAHLSTARLAQLAGIGSEKILPLIFVARPATFHDLTDLLQNLGSYINPKMALIAVDTVTSLYRSELRVGNVFHMNRELNLQLGYLREIARAHELKVILTSQVRSLPQSSIPSVVEPVATRVLKYWSENILRIISSEGWQSRELMVEKASRPSAIRHRLQTRLANEGFVEADPDLTGNSS